MRRTALIFFMAMCIMMSAMTALAQDDGAKANRSGQELLNQKTAVTGQDGEVTEPITKEDKPYLS